MVLRRSACLPTRVTRRDTLGQRFGAAVFTLAPCHRDARSPLELAQIRDAIALLECSPKGTFCGTHGDRVIGPDGGGQPNG
ncbi:hypothetical protein OIV57_23060 [Burkholderia pseudomallei]|uniref:hypothetical protein n=1 Tax=Burkholderia TaxID=32008 RepID=UPI001053EAFF|nr:MULTISPECIES: hypothetical protein [Burkholderia]MCV9915015.1 hypothetical protein [Burkholderia pseudomallei]MCW0071053.1 hypothetical protein [Burkholderia pseudomallei]MDN7900903.1 hypothetical protein [Burkholderia cepacia]TCW75527.1 hypothetical protein C5O80_37700 [Burkholderia sp. SRS-46]